MQKHQKIQKLQKILVQRGLDLCRTEHMFFDEERILSVREMILSKTKEDRSTALRETITTSKKRFYGDF